MRIAASRADRLGFTVFAVLAALLAVLLITNVRGGDGDSTAATEVSSLSGTIAAPAATAVPTTAPIAVPDPTPTPSPPPLPTATPTPDAEADAAAGVAGDEADGNDNGDATTTTVAASAQPSGNSANTDTAAPNPQPQATAVPNPQPQATEVPNPQPKATEVPNPQPGAPIDIPAAAPTGGTFTHTLRATVAQPTLYTTPGGTAFMPTFNGQALPPVNPTVFGNPLVYRVLAGQPGDAWAQVYVPARPNGQTAWVQTSQFTWGSSNRMIVINISNNTVTVYEGNNVLLTTAAVTGKGSSRTPIANGWVEETMAGPSSAYGPLLISLGVFSEDLNSFGGGIPKIALHGTNNPSLMGQYASNGCIRVPNDVITQIAGMVQPGSKVILTR